MNEIPYWKQQELDKKSKKEHEIWLSENVIGYNEFFGKTIFFSGEYGVMILGEDKGKPCLIMRWDTPKEFDGETFYGGNWVPDIIEEPYEFTYINRDGTLKEEYRDLPTLKPKHGKRK